MPLRARNHSHPDPSSTSPHPDAAPTSPLSPLKLARSRSSSSLALFRTRSRGDDLASPQAMARGLAADEGPSQDGIRLVGSYESPNGPALVTSPERERSSPSGSLLSPSQQPNKLTRWLTGSSASSSPTSSSVAKDAAALPDSPTKTRKTRSRSIGSLNLLNRAIDRAPPSSTTPPATELAAPAPTISISSSPSDHFSPSQPAASTSSSSSAHSSPDLRTSSAPLNPLRRGSATSVSTTSSAATSSTGRTGASSTRRGFAHLSLKPSRSKKAGGDAGVGKRPRSAGSSSLDAAPAETGVEDGWATAELEDGDEDGRRISEAMVRAASASASGGGSRASSVSAASVAGVAAEGRLARGLRKTRSGLRLFAKAKEQAAADAAGEHAGVYAHPAAGASASLLDLAPSPAPASLSSCGATPTSATFPASSSGEGSVGAPLSPNANGNVAGRIGGWFSSMLHPGASSSTHLPLPEESNSAPSSPEKARSSAPPRAPSSPATSSPLKKGSSTSATGAGVRLGPLDRMLDRAVQYFLDSDSQADRCEEDIWVLGVRHPGWRAPEEGEEGEEDDEAKRRGLPGLGRKGRGSPVKARKPAPPAQPPCAPAAAAAAEGAPSPSRSSSPGPRAPSTIHGWPAAFYHDFYSRPALTYRSHFPLIPCEPAPSSGGVGGMLSNLSMSIGRGGGGSGGRQHPQEESRGLSTDAGWGCMLRTGQSLLANALVKVHLGRDWRRPLPPSSPGPTAVPAAGTYARLLSLFLDDPSPLSPFSVHRFAAEGKRLGKDVGEWFGPSTAAGAIKSLVNAFEPAGLCVVSCMNGAVYESEVVAASAVGGDKWQRPVLVLINLRLGIDGVNPIYHEAVKGIFRFPQSVGIAGGRPSSSYYFVGAQASSLFYIDPHHPRPAVPLVLPQDEALQHAAQHVPLSPRAEPAAHAKELDAFLREAYPDGAWATYHCERVRKCALASLDPSMLLGFVVEDERDWEDFRRRVAELAQSSAPIFSIAPSPPRWMRRTTSSAQPSPVHPSHPASSANAATADDSFSEIGVDDAPQALGEGEAGEGASEGFSEPEDWELQSTDGSSSGDALSGEATPAAAAGRPVAGSPVDGEDAVVVSPPLAPRRDAVDEGWLGVEAERSA